MAKQKKRKFSLGDKLIITIIGFCIILTAVVAIILIPRINSKEARAETYVFKDFEYPGLFLVVAKRGFSVDLLRNDRYRQFLYISDFSEAELDAYENYLIGTAGFTPFPTADSRWHRDITYGRRDDNNEPRYLNLTQFNENSAVNILLF